MSTDLRTITDFEDLIAYLGTELDWPVEDYNLEELTFEYDAEELGLKDEEAEKLKDGTIRQLRPLPGGQPFGIFFVEFGQAKLPVVVLRRILNALVIKKRNSANPADRQRWDAADILFISAFGESDDREIAFAHFHKDPDTTELPVLRVLGWHGSTPTLKTKYVADVLKSRLAWPEDPSNYDAWRQQWSKAFRNRIGHEITTAKELAQVLAQFAGRVRDAARTVMSYESETGRMRQLHKGFKEALIHNLSEDDFATYYAETICYGLFTVAVSKTELSEGKYGTAIAAEDVAHFVPVTNPFLQKILWSFLDAGGRAENLNFDDLGINEIVTLLNGEETNLPAVLRDFGNVRPGEDPVIHLYEDFLKQFDAELRKKRGVYYTPKPIVSYIVRSVHELLQSEFDIEDGLASTITWGEMLVKHPDLELPALTDLPGERDTISHNEPFVQILDPATGTATFIVETIEVIHTHLSKRWKQQGLSAAAQKDAWNEYVPKHLLPRLHGYELMMAPYAIAHMKIGLKLAETGYRFGTEERARIYLTNALDPWLKQLPLIGFDALAQEAAAVNEIKREKRFTVIIGNPPYSARSANLTEENRRLVDRYRSINGVRIKEKSMLQFEKNIQDDYIKFFVLAEDIVETTNAGVLGYVTNHSYLDGPTLRGMRASLVKTFPLIDAVDLHGNSNKKEGKTRIDENVFGIQQGVSIALFRHDLTSGSGCNVAHFYGTRSEKCGALMRHSISTTPRNPFDPQPENYHFIAFQSQDFSEYEKFVPMVKLFLKKSMGTKTGFNELILDFSKSDLIEKVARFGDPNTSAIQLVEEYQAKKGHAALVLSKRNGLCKGDWEKWIKPFQVFPFDYRWGFLRKEFLQGHRFGTMLNLDKQHPGLVATRQTKENFGVFVAGGFCGHKLLGSYDSNDVFPVFDLMIPGMTFVDQRVLRAYSNVTDSDAKLPSEIELMNYAYAVFHSPGYRNRYIEFLKIDFPRLPLTANPELFRALNQLGEELTALHLLESPKLTQPITVLIGCRHPEVEKISWSANTVWVDKKQTIGFQGVPEDVWNFHIGGYQVCEKWLKDRKGRILNDEDIAHYHKIVIALTETIRLMAEIDEVIETHGGWPGAFAQHEGSKT